MPVGEPDDDRPAAPRAGGRAVHGHLRAGARLAELDVRPGPGRARPGAGHPLAARGLREGRARVRAGRDGPGHRGHPGRRGGDRRLPADHPRPGARVGGTSPRGRARPVPGAATRGDRGGQCGRLPGREQRRVPVRVRQHPGRLRGRLPDPVRPAGPAVRAAGYPAVPGRRHDHRGRRPAVDHAGPVRRGLPRSLQVQPNQADRDAGAMGLRPGPVPDPGVRRHDRLSADQGALLQGAHRPEPVEDRPGRAGPVRLDHPALPRGAGRTAVRRRDAAGAAATCRGGMGGRGAPP